MLGSSVGFRTSLKLEAESPEADPQFLSVSFGQVRKKMEWWAGSWDLLSV